MQISSFSMSPTLPPVKASASSSEAATTSTDSTETNFTNSADSFSGLVQQAGQMPDVRSELVDSFKSRIQAGEYPTPETIDNLTDAIGSSIVRMADASQTD
jgi:anti-sigma28 factor (negative regulator of flagellin synthesis)